MTNTSIAAKTDLVIFDLFGTLIQYGAMHHPFHQLLKWARENGRQPKVDDARKLMTINADIPELAAALNISAPSLFIDQIKTNIQEELDSLSLYADVKPTLRALSDRGIPFAICSNLAFPYGEAVDRLLSEFQFIRCMSYEVGFIKPDAGIYQFLIDKTNVRPENCLFIGDTLLADYDGPTQFGMNALHLVRDKPVGNHFTINSLTEIIPFLVK
ncbi:MAG TPA: HAD family hydrolase [Cellvibrio sp.]|nr:HAD family hydrolase [Cellvibrio sp.]